MKFCFKKIIFSGTLTVEEVYKDRDQFASLVREVAAPDVGRMGIEVLSFTIKDVYDNVTYLASLGKKGGYGDLIIISILLIKFLAEIIYYCQTFI